MTTIVRQSVRRGFTLAEVMFSVVILGIGFILVAAVFPVAILQTRTTVEETGGQAFARSVADKVRVLAQSERGLPAAQWMFLPTGGALSPERGRVFSVLNPQSNAAGNLLPTFAAWEKLRAVLLPSSDPRNAAVVLYRRGGNTVATADPFAQIFVVAVTPRNASTFTAADVDAAKLPNDTLNLQARPVQFSFNPLTGLVTVNGGFGQPAAVVEGGFLIVADDDLPAPNTGRLNGRIYRFGRNLGGNLWELAAGYTFVDDPAPDGLPANDITGLTDAYGFVVGRSLTDPADTAGDHTGPAMDVAVFTTFIPIPD